MVLNACKRYVLIFTNIESSEMYSMDFIVHSKICITLVILNCPFHKNIHQNCSSAIKGL